MATSRLQTLFAQFARRNGLRDFRPDEKGHFHLLADDHLSIRFFERFGQLHLVSPLGDAAAQDPADQDWVRRLLKFALRRMKQSGCALALEESGDLVLFSRLELAGLAVDGLESSVEQHINDVEKFERVLEEAGAFGHQRHPSRPMGERPQLRGGMPVGMLRP